MTPKQLEAKLKVRLDKHKREMIEFKRAEARAKKESGLKVKKKLDAVLKIMEKAIEEKTDKSKKLHIYPEYKIDEEVLKQLSILGYHVTENEHRHVDNDNYNPYHYSTYSYDLRWK